MAKGKSFKAYKRGGMVDSEARIKREAMQRKDGGSVEAKKDGGEVIAKKDGGSVPGFKSGGRLDKFARGGRTGADKNPFSSAKC